MVIEMTSELRERHAAKLRTGRRSAKKSKAKIAPAAAPYQPDLASPEMLEGIPLQVREHQEDYLKILTAHAEVFRWNSKEEFDKLRHAVLQVYAAFAWEAMAASCADKLPHVAEGFRRRQRAHEQNYMVMMETFEPLPVATPPRVA